MPLGLRIWKPYRARYVLQAPTELDYVLKNPVATITKIVWAYSAAQAWETCRVELQLSALDARRRTKEGVPVLSVEEV